MNLITNVLSQNFTDKYLSFIFEFLFIVIN